MREILYEFRGLGGLGKLRVRAVYKVGYSRPL